MLDRVAIISGDGVTDIIIITTLVLFFFFVGREVNATWKAISQLKSIASLKSGHTSDVVEREKVSESQFKWLVEHLVYTPTENGLKVDSKEGLWLTKSPLSHMLPPCDSTRYKLVPALLTSIGITGTFLGITIGLSQFSMAGDSKALLASAAELLEGMKTAFYTSLAGLSSSALFMALMKVSSSRLSKAQANFLKAISSEYYEASAIHYLKNMSNDGQQEVVAAQLRSATAIENMSQQFRDTAASLNKLGDSFNGDAIADKVSEAVTGSIEEQLTPAVQAITVELSALRDIKEQSQKELVEQLVDKMKSELIDPVSEELKKTSEAVSQSNEVSAQLNANVEKVVTSTAQTVETINEFQKDTMDKLQQFAESLKQILASFKDDTQGAMSTIAKEVQTLLDGASKGLEEQRDAFELSAGRASAAFEGIKTSMDGALNERQQKEKALFDGVETRINALIEGSSAAFKQQTDVLEAVGEQASSLMTSAKQELESGLGDIDEKVKSMSTTVQKELEAFRLQYQQNLTAYFEQQNSLLEDSLSKQRNGLNEVVENFRKVFESEYQARHNLLQELTAQYEKLEASAQTVERVAKAIGLNEASRMAELQDAAQTMGRQIALLKKEYATASASFTDVTENLPKAMDEYFSRANESFETFFNDFDQSASTIHNKLSQAAGYLINAQVQNREFEADRAEA
ncbi:chemotaxis protein [Vibrio mediterranei]|uniref:chemotaxis protein n=1 Tax=Vibrio mediterranei TaxID=689 RepID=UPI001EFD8A9C|nr:chemotaxis protein [Vibrio mediterranei]MCG9665942.1 chemotaxis protein [Vibrio mediterranei]